MQEKKLPQSDDASLLKTVMETSPISIVTIDLKGSITYANTMAEKVLGLTRDAITSLSYNAPSWKHTYFDGRPFPEKELPTARVLATGKPVFDVQHAIEHPDGTRVFLSINAAPLNDTAGKLTGVVAVFEDVTKRVVSDQSIRENEKRFRALFDNMSSGVAIYEARNNGADFYFRDLNRAGEIMDGMRREEVVGRSVLEVFPGVKEFGLFDVFRRVWKTGEPEHHPVSMYQDERISRWFENYVYKLPSGEIVAIHDDITERMQAEGALKQSEQIHRSIIEFSPVGMHLYELLPDDRLIFTGANPAADRILGVDNSAFIGKTIEEAFPPLAATDVPAAYREVVKTGVPWETEQVNYESAAIAGLFHVVAFKIGENRMAATFEDITDRKQLEELRQRTQKLESLGLLAGGIAHDFNNLLGGMFGYVDLAYSELSNGNPGDNDPAEARNYLLKSLAVFDRTKALTAQLITFAKGGAPIRRVQDIAPLIRKNVEFSLSGSSVSGDCDIDEGLWHCNCDENQIGQVLDNIVINGQQAMPSGGRLVVTAENHLVEEREAKKERPAGKYVRVSIRDEGIGIPREMLPKIFDPFFTTKTKGHGLGLATVYSIVKRHGGWIDVESETGKGTTFHVFLPATEAAGAAESAAVKSSHQGHGRALIMDDEQFILETVGAMLQALGYEVVAAREGREATRIFAEAHAAGRPFAVTFLDLTIPGGRGGREVVPLLRRISPDSPVVVVSGYSEDPVMMNPESFGFSGGLVKPFRKSELSELLDRIVKNGP